MSVLKQNPLTSKIAAHTVGWIAFAIYEQCFLWFVNNKPGLSSAYFYYLACNIGLFYTHIHVLNKTNGRSPRRYVERAILVIGAVIIFLVLKAAGEYFFDTMGAHINNPPLFRRYIVLDLFRNVYFIGFGTLYWSASSYSRLEKEAAETDIQLGNTRNALLQQRINPHLVFNALNFVYYSVYKNSEKAADVIYRLTEILRFSMSASQLDIKVAVSHEAEQINNLIMINRARFDYPLNIRFDYKSDTKTSFIIPFVLLTLTENIFKHGILKDEDIFINLSVTASGCLTFKTKNKQCYQKNTDLKEGTGLRNTRLRLAYAYPSHRLFIDNTLPDFFQLSLQIQL
jgi:hypothetical protein